MLHGTADGGIESAAGEMSYLEGEVEGGKQERRDADGLADAPAQASELAGFVEATATTFDLREPAKRAVRAFGQCSLVMSRRGELDNDGRIHEHACLRIAAGQLLNHRRHPMLSPT